MRAGVKRGLYAGSLALITIVGFQNCSDFALQDQVLYEQGLFDSQSVWDQKALPVLLEADYLTTWSKPGNSEFVNQATILANEISIIVAIDRSMTGKILSINSGTNDDAYIEIVDDKVRAVHASTENDRAYLEADLPSVGDKVLIAASFGVASEQISLLLNGVVQNAEIQKVGTPTDFPTLAKAVTPGGSNGQIYEYVIFAGADEGELSKGELNVMSRYVANNNLITNVIFDPVLIEDEGGGSIEVNPKFVLAKAVIDAKCLSCHSSGSSNGDFSNLTESKAIQRGLVAAKSPATSKLYYRLTEATSGPGARNMPTSGSISAAEAQTISDWINSIE